MGSTLKGAAVMKITILVYGSLGDVQPYVALGAGLKRAGHDVSVAADPFYESTILKSGVSFVPVAGNPNDIFGSEAAQTVADSQAGIMKRFAAYGAFNREMKTHIAKNLEESWPACRNAEAFIFSFNAFGGYHIAEKLGVPSFAVSIAPFTRTRTMPSINFGEKKLGSSYNLLTHRLTEQIFFAPPSSNEINRWRKESLGLRPLSWKGYMRRLSRSSDIPVLYSFSRELMPPPPDWPEWVHVNGYWFSERDPDWRPPQPLVDFLASGPPPVYIGFGSMAFKSELKMVFQALDRAGQRGIVSVAAQGIEDVSFPPTVFRADALPHDWLFPQVSMTVHHGGSGTTAQSARAGVPMLITPFMWDQPFWGRRVHAASLGPEPIPHKKLTAENLSAAIQHVVGNNEMRDRARKLGERVRSEDGVRQTVAVIEERLRKRGHLQ